MIVVSLTGVATWDRDGEQSSPDLGFLTARIAHAMRTRGFPAETIETFTTHAQGQDLAWLCSMAESMDFTVQ